MAKNLTERRGPKIELPGIAAKELREALVGEVPVRVRKRLIGLLAIAEGASRPEAAKRAKAALSTVDNWLRAARRSGWKSLIRAMPGTKPMKVENAERVRKQIRRVLSGKLDGEVRTRLIAVDRVLGGDKVGVTATELGFTRAAVSLWLRKLRRHGVDALLKHEPERKRHVEADSKALRTLAAKTRDRRYAKALRAIAHLADGDSIFAAAIAVDASHSAARGWLDDYRKGGTEALKLVRTGRRPRLSPAQMEELAEVIQARPDISYKQLEGAVASRFGVAYTRAGLERLVRHALGFRREGKLLVNRKKRFTRVSPQNIGPDNAIGGTADGVRASVSFRAATRQAVRYRRRAASLLRSSFNARSSARSSARNAAIIAASSCLGENICAAAIFAAYRLRMADQSPPTPGRLPG